MSAQIVTPDTLPVVLESGRPASRHSPANLDVSDLLADLEFRIARRADEIAATLPARTELNLYCWLKAEHEIMPAADFPDQPRRKIR